MPESYDVFISYAHADAAAVRPLTEALRRHGLAVWFDAQATETFTGITRAIATGLARSKVVVAFYSRTYPTRRACQWELCAAFLSAQRAGRPAERLLVVNLASGVDHIQPVELRDALFASAADPEAVAQKVVARVAAIDVPLGEIQVLDSPTWFGNRAVGLTNFVGRLDDLWGLHSALHASDFAIITDRVGSTVVQVRGLGAQKGRKRPARSRQRPLACRAGDPPRLSVAHVQSQRFRGHPRIAGRCLEAAVTGGRQSPRSATLSPGRGQCARRPRISLSSELLLASPPSRERKALFGVPVLADGAADFLERLGGRKTLEPGLNLLKRAAR